MTMLARFVPQSLIFPTAVAASIAFIAATIADTGHAPPVNDEVGAPTQSTCTSTTTEGESAGAALLHTATKSMLMVAAPAAAAANAAIAALTIISNEKPVNEHVSDGSENRDTDCASPPPSRDDEREQRSHR